MNCWEYKKCENKIKKTCPAYINDMGFECWIVTGTKCGGGIVEMVSFYKKLLYCRECDFYKKINHEY